MRNLAGVKDCDVYIMEEIEKAGIDMYCLEKPENSEVPFVVYGGLGGRPLTIQEKNWMFSHGLSVEVIKNNCSFVFTRAWYYWVVRGYVPLDIAVEMYENPNGQKDIRANGHCACPHPFEQKLPYKVCGMNVVDLYHIDTQAALNYFVDTLKKHQLV